MKKFGKSIYAIIPARGGSKRIPQKNIVNFCGKPLLVWTIEQTKKSKHIDSVYVTTDDEKIAAIAKQAGAKIIRRPEEISGDRATSEDALKHALVEIQKKKPENKIEFVVFLQATSPLKETKDIDQAIEEIRRQKADSLFSAGELSDFFIWSKNKKRELESLNYDYKNRKMSQDFEKQYLENGAIYVFKPEVLFKNNNRIGGKIVISIMDFWKSSDINTLEDLQYCEQIFKLKGLNKN